MLFSALYNTLIKENSSEKYDERRVNLLKSQLMQLERQVPGTSMIKKNDRFANILVHPSEENATLG